MRKVSRIPLFIGTIVVSLMLAVTNLFTLPTFTGHYNVDTPVTAEAATDYYASIDTTLKGQAFRSEVAELITSTQRYNTTYDELREVYPYSDADPKTSGNILWFYTGTSFRFTGSFNNGTNREHVWPKNAGRAFPEKSECGSDAHHLRPANDRLNSTRSNNNFGEVPETNGNIVAEAGKTSYPHLCYQTNSVFYPGETYRGATARILMYVQTRWGDAYNLQFVLGKGSNKTIGDIEDLLKWHYLEPPTAEEIARNEYVYSIQGNRNPFIDHPEYATKIYCYDGKSYNSTLLNVAKTYDKYTDEKPVVATSVTVTPEEKECVVGDTFTISATASPSNAVCEFRFTSDDTSVATVDASGKVKAVGAGLATITVKETNSGIQKTVVILVENKTATGITVTPEEMECVVGDEFTISATASPVGAVCNYQYTSDDTSVATVDGNGKVTAVGAGLATITVKENNSGIQKTVAVVVKNKISSAVNEFGTKVLMVKAKQGKSNVYAAILDALSAYNKLNDDEKALVQDNYTQLIEQIELYNLQAELVNSSAEKAFGSAWTALKPDDYKDGE